MRRFAFYVCILCLLETFFNSPHARSFDRDLRHFFEWKKYLLFSKDCEGAFVPSREVPTPYNRPILNAPLQKNKHRDRQKLDFLEYQHGHDNKS